MLDEFLDHGGFSIFYPQARRVAYVTRLQTYFVNIKILCLRDDICKRTLKPPVTKEPTLVSAEHLLLLPLEILDRDSPSNRRFLEKPPGNFRQSLRVCEPEVVENLLRVSLPRLEDRVHADIWDESLLGTFHSYLKFTSNLWRHSSKTSSCQNVEERI